MKICQSRSFCMTDIHYNNNVITFKVKMLTLVNGNMHACILFHIGMNEFIEISK